MSKGATWPRNSDAMKDETSDILDVFLYTSGYFLWNRKI